MSLDSFLISGGILGIFTVTVLYPLTQVLRAHRKAPVTPPSPSDWPTVAVITGARNAASLLEAKLANFYALDYPEDRLTLLVASDASTDETEYVVKAAGDPRVQLVEQKERLGKASAMNRAILQTDAELLLFSDADARFAPDVVRKLARHFSDPDVGGVCGLRISERSGTRLHDAQQTYIDLDSALKKAESAQGRISSNDGKIHMIRRRLFAPIPPDVTDDLFTALSVMAQGYRFLFEPAAVVEARVPSRDARHEIQRRRRIVTRSLTGIFRNRRILNPFRFGWFSVGLLINKVGRRLLPLFLLMLAAGIVRTLLAAPGILAVLVLLGIGVLAGSRLAQYILAGFIGTSWGVIDFLLGRRVCMWEPAKAGKVST